MPRRSPVGVIIMAEIKSKVNRDSRKVLSFLSSICGQRGVEFDTSPIQGYMTDMLMMMYYPTPIINILKSSAGRTKGFQTKHGTIEYWLPMLMNMQKGESLKSAVRPDRVRPDWTDNPIIQIPLGRYNYITSQYLLTDYSYNDMIALMRICNTVDDKIIERACGVGKQNGVYSIPYIRAVIEGELAKEQLKQQNTDRFMEKVNHSVDVLNDTIHQHNVMELAQMEYEWQKMNENSEIERMWAKHYEEI